MIGTAAKQGNTAGMEVATPRGISLEARTSRGGNRFTLPRQIHFRANRAPGAGDSVSSFACEEYRGML